MNIELRYCSMWGYEPKALSLSDRLLNSLKQRISGLKLIPSGGGCFEVTVDGELIYSKLATGVFPDEAEIQRMVETRPKK